MTLIYFVKLYNRTILACFISITSLAQKDSVVSIYKNLEVKKFYNVYLTVDTLNGKAIYKAENKIIDKNIYDKYKATRKNIENCKPCIIETYDVNEKLIYRAAKFEDCPVGEWISYYPNGKIKEIGHYRENDTGNWEDLWNSAYCIKHGSWIFYDEKGKVTKTENYSFGNLVEPKKN